MTLRRDEDRTESTKLGAKRRLDLAAARLATLEPLRAVDVWSVFKACAASPQLPPWDFPRAAHVQRGVATLLAHARV